MLQSFVVAVSIFLSLSNCSKVVTGDGRRDPPCLPYLIKTESESEQYLVFPSCFGASNVESRIRCQGAHGKLVDIDSTNLFYNLTSKISDPSYINSFRGNDFGLECIVLYPNGGISTPSSGCSSHQGSICQVPIFGNARIRYEGKILQVIQDTEMAKNDRKLEETKIVDLEFASD